MIKESPCIKNLLFIIYYIYNSKNCLYCLSDENKNAVI